MVGKGCEKMKKIIFVFLFSIIFLTDSPIKIMQEEDGRSDEKVELKYQINDFKEVKEAVKTLEKNDEIINYSNDFFVRPEIKKINDLDVGNEKIEIGTEEDTVTVTINGKSDGLKTDEILVDEKLMKKYNLSEKVKFEFIIKNGKASDKFIKEYKIVGYTSESIVGALLGDQCSYIICEDVFFNHDEYNFNIINSYLKQSNIKETNYIKPLEIVVKKYNVDALKKNFKNFELLNEVEFGKSIDFLIVMIIAKSILLIIILFLMYRNKKIYKDDYDEKLLNTYLYVVFIFIYLLLINVIFFNEFFEFNKITSILFSVVYGSISYYVIDKIICKLQNKKSRN